jgi:hypothetical protein
MDGRNGPEVEQGRIDWKKMTGGRTRKKLTGRDGPEVEQGRI